MNRTERLTAILDLLAVSGQLHFDDIIRQLDVSAATARRERPRHPERRDRPLRRHDQHRHRERAGAGTMEASPHSNLTVVTNAINIAAHLAMRPQINAVVSGGVINSCSYELVGPFTDSILNQATMDLAFIGVKGATTSRESSHR